MNDVERFDPAPVLAGLKDFQRATVAQASQQLFDTPGSSRRFLVADETGLGNTMVARGVIANAIEHHLERGTDRIDVIYICSNGDIARQNIRRLNVVPGNDFHHASRLTLLPATIGDLRGRRLNFISFTPGTSFDLRSSEGTVSERALVWSMLQQLWGQDVPWDGIGTRVFAGYANYDGFEGRAHSEADTTYDEELVRRFGEELALHGGGHDELKQRYVELRARFRGITSREAASRDDDLRRDRREFVGLLRQRLAHACVDALEPDLVILDEFQRFKQLFDAEDDAGALARAMFEYEDVATLLLSATPYKMYTAAGDDEDHYRDFIDTVDFLLDDEVSTRRLTNDLRGFRTHLLQLSHDTFDDAVAAKEAVEATLRRVMARTERLSVSQHGEQMITDRHPPALELRAKDATSFVAMDRLGQQLQERGARQYWEATPYPLSFLDGYKFSQAAEERLKADGGSIDATIVNALRWPLEDVDAYRRTDPSNARMRSLETDTINAGMWRLLWLPPSLPYHHLGGPYEELGREHVTKRLVFSSWAVVPKAIASYLSYEAERRQVTDGVTDGTVARTKGREWRQQGGRLVLTRSSGRLNGMPTLALLYPSVVLAGVGDPLEVARSMGAIHSPLPMDAVLTTVRDRINETLAPLVASAPADGRVDQRWYWAAPLLLDAAAGVDVEAWCRDTATHDALKEGLDASVEEDDGSDGLRDHLDLAADVAASTVLDLDLGRPPLDLADVLAQLAIAGPANASLRALHRGRGDAKSAEGRRAAASAAWGFRMLFNDPAVTRMLFGEVTTNTAEDAYWRLVLRYCFEGCVQAVLDEWTHVLTDGLQLANRPEEERLDALVEAYRGSLGSQTATYSVRRLDGDGAGRFTVSTDRVRASFARRFGDERSETAQTLQSAANVRRSFNSPFWPFVLATTSAGQEGLDFHTYCHAIVHWNLPSNPVDLEQREGRIHRYKGHAVRRNVALRYRAAGLAADGDPWTAMFDEAAGQSSGDDELVPYWVFATENGAQIERHVPALPLSREAARLEDLRKSTAAYRLVFGQPRQDDLLAYLDGNARDLDLARLRIDLRPPQRQAAAGMSVDPTREDQR